MSLTKKNRNKTYSENKEKHPIMRDVIYQLIIANPYITVSGLTRVLDKRPNDISGRITELLNIGLIKPVGTKQLKTTSHTRLLAITDIDELIDSMNAKFVHYRTKKDLIINDLNIKELSDGTKKLLRKKVQNIDHKINLIIKSQNKILVKQEVKKSA